MAHRIEILLSHLGHTLLEDWKSMIQSKYTVHIYAIHRTFRTLVTALLDTCVSRKALCYMTSVEQLLHKGLITNSQIDFLKSESSQSGIGRPV